MSDVVGVRFTALTCPGETSAGMPCNTLTAPLCKSTTQTTGTLLLVSASPQSSQYTLRSWSNTKTWSVNQHKCVSVQFKFVFDTSMHAGSPESLPPAEFLIFSATYRSFFSHSDHDRQPKWAKSTKENQTISESYIHYISVTKSLIAPFLTIVIHFAMYVEGWQVEAFSEAMAVPYLHNNNHNPWSWSQHLTWLSLLETRWQLWEVGGSLVVNLLVHLAWEDLEPSRTLSDTLETPCSGFGTAQRDAGTWGRESLSYWQWYGQSFLPPRAGGCQLPWQQPSGPEQVTVHSITWRAERKICMGKITWQHAPFVSHMIACFFTNLSESPAW